MTRRDALLMQSALLFYANPLLSEGGTFVECTVRVEERQQASTIQIIAMGRAARNCKEFAT